MQHDKEGKWHKDWFNLETLKILKKQKHKYRINSKEFSDLYDKHFSYSRDATKAK
jgi:hypothetical protein